MCRVFPSVFVCMLRASLWLTFDVLLLFCRISRLFSDAKKILLYSQNDKNLEGFKELAQALQVLQSSRSGRTRKTQPSLCGDELRSGLAMQFDFV